MAHRSSSAALHAARVILDHYNVSVIPRERLRANVSAIPNLQATDAYMSVLIDYTTNAFEVVNLRPELKHWQKQLHEGEPTPGQLLMYLQHLIERMERVPKDKPVEERETFTPDALPTGPRITFASEQVRLKAAQSAAKTKISISSAAKQATVYLFAFYAFAAKKKTFFNETAMQMDVAKTIEVCLGLTKAMPALPLAKTCAQELRGGRLTLAQIKSYFRELGVLLEYLPNFQGHEEETKLLV